jgi:hypothetical protein
MAPVQGNEYEGIHLCKRCIASVYAFLFHTLRRLLRLLSRIIAQLMNGVLVDRFLKIFILLLCGASHLFAACRP